MTTTLDSTTAEAPDARVLSAHWDEPESWTLRNYRSHGGYDGVRAAFAMSPDEVIELVKASGLRGRGGAGFPVGMKWSFIPQSDDPDAPPHYLVVNADESEPGTCKDMPLMLSSPHALIEGIIIACYAIRAANAFIYVRGEVASVIRRLRTAVAEAYEAGLLGRDILGSGIDIDLVVHAGAGAYICGEETALLDSLEGRRGQPRSKPPFPGAAGLYARPTSVNNVESIASVPGIILEGVDWFTGMGTEKSTGFGIFSLSGHASVNEIHGILGYTNFLVAIAATVFAFQAKKINDSLKGLFMHAMSLPVMAFIQIGIIEAAKGNSGMKWAHVVIGIAYLVSAVGLYMLADKKSHAHR